MNVPTKLLKQSNGLPSQTCTVTQTLSKKYFKISKKQKPVKETNKKEGSVSLARRDSTSHTSNESKAQEEILKWFFSLDFPKRVKVCSIQNKFLGNILHQMYTHSDLDTRVKFQLRPLVHSEESEGEFYPIIYNNKSNSVSFVNVNVNNVSNFSKTGDAAGVNTYLNYFYPNNYVQTNIVLNNYLKNNENMERDFLREVKFYKCEEQNDTMILSSDLLTKEDQFRKFFNYFSNDRFFTKGIGSTYDPSTKLYQMHLPDWVTTKDYYSFCQILVAFFEQVISIWFFFSKNLDDQAFNSLLQSTNYEKKISDLLEDSDKIVTFLKKTLLSNSDTRKLFEEFNMKSLSNSVRKDETIAEIISIKRRIADNVYNQCFNNCFFHHTHDRRSVSEILSEIECRLRTSMYTLTKEKFVESLLFMTFDKLFSYEDFLLKKVWEEIYNIYTRQNALDLMNEEFSVEGKIPTVKKSVLITPEIAKRKKNLKKNKKVKRYEKDESMSSSSEKNNIITDEKNANINVTLVNNDFINIKPKREEELSEFNSLKNAFSNDDSPTAHSKNEEYVKTLVHTLITKAIESLENSDEKPISQNSKTNSNDFNGTDTDTAYSSSNFSDGVKINPKIKNRKKKDKSNNFFLYTINPAHLKANSSKQKNNETEKVSKNSNSKSSSPIKEGESDRDSLQKIIKEVAEKEKICTSIQIESKIKEESVNIEKKEKEYACNKGIMNSNSNDIVNENNIDISPNNKSENTSFEFNNSNIENKNINITVNSPVYNNFYIINNNNNNNNPNNFYNPSPRMLMPGNNSFHVNNFYNFPPYKNPYSPSNYSPNKHFIQEDFMCNQMFATPNPYPYHQPYDNYKKFLHFNNLHNDILSYSMDVNENVTLLKGLKMAIIKKLEGVVKESLNEYNISFNLYGSFSTDLEIESSDIDITVRYQNKIEDAKKSLQSQSYLVYNYSTEWIINRLVKTLTNTNMFDSVNPIYTASVPVIKLQVDINSFLEENEQKLLDSFKRSDKYKNYKFSKEELDKVRIDLTFMDVNKTNVNVNHYNKLNTFESPSQQAVEYVKNSLLCFPEIRPLIHVLKRFLQLEKMNSTFNGGISSFSLFLTIFAFLKMRKLNSNFAYNNNLGNLLVEYLDFFSNFNFNCTFIDVNSSNPFIISNEILEQIPLILDPTTYLNAGKSSYKIEEVKQIFMRGSSFLHNQLCAYERSPNLINSLLDQSLLKSN